MVSVMGDIRDADDMRCCSIELKRQNTYFDEVIHTHSEEDKRDINSKLPVVDLKPFTRKVWRRGKSTFVKNLEPLSLPNSAKNKFSERKQIYRDSILILAELNESRQIGSDELERFNRQRLLTYPKKKPFPVKPVGFSSTLDREKTTLDEIRGGDSENIRFSLNKRSLGPNDFARQREMKLAGTCALGSSPNNSPRNQYSFPVDWKVSTKPKIPGPTRELTDGYLETVFHSRAEEIHNRRQLQPLNLDKSRSNISTASLMRGREKSFNVPFTCNPVAKERKPKTFLERQNSLYEPSLGQILNKINYGAKPDPGTLTSFQLTGTRNVIMRTFGPPTQGETLLKMAIDSNHVKGSMPLLDERQEYNKLSVTPTCELECFNQLDDSEGTDTEIHIFREAQGVDDVSKVSEDGEDDVSRVEPSSQTQINSENVESSTFGEKEAVDDVEIVSEASQMGEASEADQSGESAHDKKNEEADAEGEDSSKLSDVAEADNQGEDDGRHINRTFLTSPLDADAPHIANISELQLEDVTEEIEDEGKDDKVDNEDSSKDKIQDDDSNDNEIDNSDNNLENSDLNDLTGVSSETVSPPNEIMEDVD